MLYFQQLRPLAKCTAEDGDTVGHLIMELVESKPKDLAHEIRKFANCMAMLRECGFRIGAFLVALTSPDHTKIASQNIRINVGALPENPAAVSEEQAAAIGMNLVATIGQPPVAAAAVREAVELSSVLRTMRSRYDWFVPMLAVLLVQAAHHRRSTSAKRLSSLVRPSLDATEEIAEESAIHMGTDAEDADASSFDSLVRLVLLPPVVFCTSIRPLYISLSVLY
jgi:hypothetical protein